MRNIYKYIITLILVLFTLTSAFADDGFDAETLLPKADAAYAQAMKPVTKTFARVAAMGGAGIATRNNSEALYLNPASLAEKGLTWNVPNFALTVYNVKDIVDTGILEEKDFNEEFLSKSLTTLIGTFGSGNNKLMSIDVGVGAKLGRLAFAEDVKITAHTFTPPTGTADLSAVLSVDSLTSLGLGIRFFRNNPFSFDVGVAGRLAVKAYSQKFDIMTFINDTELDLQTKLTEQTPFLVAYAIPVDVGVNVNMPLGFTFSTVLRNLNGDYHFGGVDSTMGLEEIDVDSMTGIYKVDPSLDLGFGWSSKYPLEGLLDITLAADLVDTLPIFKGEKKLSTETLLTHSKLGVEVEVLKLVELRCGLNQGYVSIGAGFNLFNLIHLETAYYRQEFGPSLGDHGVDAITIRGNIFWER